jgi:hypothetical protein
VPLDCTHFGTLTCRQLHSCPRHGQIWGLNPLTETPIPTCWQRGCRRRSGAAAAARRILQGGRNGARQSLVLVLWARSNGRQKQLARMSSQDVCISPQPSRQGLVLVLPRNGLVVMRGQ